MAQLVFLAKRIKQGFMKLSDVPKACRKEVQKELDKLK